MIDKRVFELDYIQELHACLVEATRNISGL